MERFLKDLFKGNKCNGYERVEKWIESNEDGIVKGGMIFKNVETGEYWKVNATVNMKGVFNEVTPSGIVARPVSLFHFTKPEKYGRSENR